MQQKRKASFAGGDRMVHANPTIRPSVTSAVAVAR